MNTIQNIVDRLDSGVEVDVEFNEGVEDLETYAETGMRARIIGYRKVDDGVVQLKADFGHFEDHNRSFETANYYDRNHEACLTAREAGHYPADGVEPLYCDLDAEIAVILDSASAALFARYRDEAPGVSYVRWLEQQLSARSA